jgi:hypothetical protein
MPAIIVDIGLPVDQHVRPHLASIDGDCAGTARCPTGPERFLPLHADASFPAASPMKVPVMGKSSRQARADRLAPDGELPLENSVRGLVDDSRYVLDPADDT